MKERIDFRAMGCQMMAALDSKNNHAARKLESVPQWFEEWEQCLSRFRPDSELSQVNRSSGGSCVVSKTFGDVYQAALDSYHFTNGLVTPAVFDAVVEAGYDRSFDKMDGQSFHSGSGLSVGVSELALGAWDPTTRRLQLPGNLHLDLGGVAKGWAAHQAARRLQAYGDALVDAGGDIAISGLRPDGQAWPVAIANPFQPDQEMGILMLGKCGVATSGKDYRRWKKGDAWMHHIIDPRTGTPAQTDVWSATVIAPTVLQAEAAAKTVLILGSWAGLSWLEEHASFHALLVLEDGRKRYSRNFRDYLWSAR